MKIGVCIRAKDEQKIICDWVKYYFKIGFDKIIIYDNLSNPSIESILTDNNLLDDKIEIHIDPKEYSNQNDIYLDCIKNNKDLDWILLCDADEFLYIKEGTVKDFLNIFSEDTSTILINWVVYGTSDNKTYDKTKTIYEQFLKRESYNHFWNIFVKSFVRPKLIERVDNFHITYNNNYKIKNVYNNEVAHPNNRDKCDNKDCNLSDDTNVVLVHYMTLDYESMQNKNKRNCKGSLLEKNSNKYTLEWYKKGEQGFKDDYTDLRMLKYSNIINKKKLYFIIYQNYNHKNIIEQGSGASEFSFYLTAFKLSNYYDVTVYNKDETPSKIDNVNYLYIPNNKESILENINDSIIIIQRHFDFAIDFHKINSSNKYIVWSHDFLENNLSHLTGKYLQNDINSYYANNNISIITVSNFHKDNIKSKFPDVNIKVIYNALFKNIYKKNNNITINKNQILFASNWAKGLEKVINIGKLYYKFNKNFKLILIKPQYCDWNPNLDMHPFIKCLGTIKNKDDYCKLIEESLCVFSTSYPETFGCVFAEALHLGTPVLGDTSVNAGFHEIINKEYMINFNKPEEVIKKINEITKNKPNVILDDKFYEDAIILEWMKVVFI